MQINFDAVLRSLDGEALLDGEKKVTLAMVACNALLATLKGDEVLSANEKLELFRLAQKASKGGLADVDAEQVTLLKKRIASSYGALIVGRSFEIIEGGKVVALDRASND